MGQEEDTERRREAFAGYTVTPSGSGDLSPRGIFMHDLPADYGEECTEEAVYHERSRVFDQPRTGFMHTRASCFNFSVT